MPLLTKANAKLLKERTYATIGLTLAPHMSSGYNVCREATAGCIQSCVLWFAGRGRMSGNRAAMIRRTRQLVESPVAFYAELQREIEATARKWAKKSREAIFRLNVASDLDFAAVAKANPSVRFYDYTKFASRCLQDNWPSNYSLTYSYNERSKREQVVAILSRGRNVSVVFDVTYNPQYHKYGSLPESVTIDGQTYRVVDGDLSDARIPEVDGCGVIVGLRLKGGIESKKAARDRGFAVAFPDSVVGNTMTITTGSVELF